MSTARYGAWIQTYTGKRFYPLDPRPEDIELEDIIWALSHQCRFSGHTRRHYSVLEHSMHVAQLCPQFPAFGLLHDASEAYLSDIPRPLKRLPEFAFYLEAEKRLMSVIAERFWLNEQYWEKVHDADKAMLAYEYEHLFDVQLPEWKKWDKFKSMCPYKAAKHLGDEYWKPEILREFFRTAAKDAGLR